MGKEVKWLAKVAERHSEWISIVNSFGEYDFAEDIVQECYLTLYKYADEEKIIKTALRLALGNLDVIDKAKNEQKYAVMISLNRRLIMPGLSTSANLPLPKSVQ